MEASLFDSWADKYDSWFTTPAGRYVKQYESELLLELLAPRPGELILDAGCGTGIFTQDVIDRGAQVIGLDLSAPMVARGVEMMSPKQFSGLCGDMSALPFPDSCFDKVFSMTALEFIEDATAPIRELTRVAKPGGWIVLTTLNSRSPWAERRKAKAREGHPLFQNIFFRSAGDMDKLIPGEKIVKTAIHFQKDTPVNQIPPAEEQGNRQKLDTGAFLAVQWVKVSEGLSHTQALT